MTRTAIKLYCFSHAGGSALTYSSWKRGLHEGIEVKPIELAGRGRRFAEPLHREFEAAAEDLYQQLQREIDESPFAFFGHSMGSLLAFELAWRVREEMNREPQHVFLSGCRSPRQLTDHKRISDLPEDAFLQELRTFGGMPDELLQNQDLLRLYLPVLKADFAVFESYAGRRAGTLPFDLTVLYGSDDSCTGPFDPYGWQEYAGRDFRAQQFEGSHFFTLERPREVTDLINSTLLSHIEQPIRTE